MKKNFEKESEKLSKQINDQNKFSWENEKLFTSCLAQFFRESYKWNKQLENSGKENKNFLRE